jgi:hypothetical protein
MDQELKQEFGQIRQEFKQEFALVRQEFKLVREEFKEEFNKTNSRIDRMSDFMITHVALKEDLKAFATKEDLHQVKSDIFDKVDTLAYRYKNLDEEKVTINSRLDGLEVKTGIV